MKHVRVRLTGLGSLLTHNERLAERFDPITQQLAAVSSKRRKTDDDHALMAELEFAGGVYECEDGTVGIPTWNIYRSIQDGAKLNRLGRDVERAVVPIGADVVPITHDGPRNPRAMWDAGCYDQRPIKVGQARVTRTRPVYRNWSVEADFMINVAVMDLDDFVTAAANAGQMVGLGDYRPRFGRFDVEVTEVAA